MVDKVDENLIRFDPIALFGQHAFDEPRSVSVNVHGLFGLDLGTVLQV